MPELQPILTIAIPTYNRANKLKRLLGWLEIELSANGLLNEVSVLVANNASTDHTNAILESASLSSRHLRIFSHPANCGFDGNVLSLYSRTTTPYLWYMGDDDLPLPGVIGSLLNLLRSHWPDVLLGPFIQPPGSWRSEFELPEPFHLITDPASAIDCIDRHWKLSSYVLRTVALSPEQTGELTGHLDRGWMFMILGFTVLQASSDLRLLQLSKPIATADEDFHVVAFTPNNIFNNSQCFTHSFVRRWLPGLLQERISSSYRQAIGFLWQGQVGDLLAEDPSKWDDFTKTLDWRFRELLTRPGLALRLILVKTGAGYLFRDGVLARVWSFRKDFLRYCQESGYLARVRRWRRQLRGRSREKQLPVSGARSRPQSRNTAA
jgi:glycosyltransferase involved in cell wall biosynthesis